MAVFNQELADKRLGERAIMKNGQQATIIAYRGAADIDIQFDDGTVVERRAYNEFKRRNIRNPQYNPPNPVAVKRIGETRTMSNGQKATIVQYRTSTDIDILFEDGCLREHVRYPHFQSGKINPVDNAVIQQSRVGEERMMNCGFKCRIIKYTKAHDITVQFDDGIVLYGKHYTDFCNGAIVHPGIYGKQMSETGKRGAVSADDRLGMQKVMANGQKATIVEYRRADDIDVQFEDGTRRNHVSFFQFQYAKIKHPSELPDAQAHARVGEKRTMKNGKSASILRYHQYCDVDIIFEDGVVVEGQRYEKFIRGEIPHPNIKYKNATSLQEFAIAYYLRNYGFRKIEQGEWKGKGFGRLELDFYNDEHQIAIEYDGAIHNKPETWERELRKNALCKKAGVTLYRLRHPRCQNSPPDSVNYTLSAHNSIITGLIDCKEELKTILEDNGIAQNVDDIDFWRDRDAIIQEFNDTYINFYSKTRIGCTSYSKSAQQSMTVVAYRDSNDIDVQFDDGALRQNVRWAEFVVGAIAHPADTMQGQQTQRLGETITLRNGFLATVINYRCSTDIDIQFEDGAVREHVDYAMFKRGWVKHPLGLSRKVFPTKQVVNKTTNVVYASAQEAAKDTGVSVDAIYKCCSGKSKTAGKFQWEYCA